ncbi:hypothetical protein V6N13_072563 [Hibiscus sabdariffa]|uniref:Uncharacterized protein n=1 Tax=Hibiscus sabdariffa TaxID=183260 RepID=A0ABR2R7A7_9ROSI
MLALLKYVGIRDQALWKTLASIITTPLLTFPAFLNELRMPEEMLATNQPKATLIQQSDATSTTKSLAKEDIEKTESQCIDTDFDTKEHAIGTTHVNSPVVPTAFKTPTPSKQI